MGEAIGCHQVAIKKTDGDIRICSDYKIGGARQPPDMFGFVSLTEYRNHQSRTRKYETLCENGKAHELERTGILLGIN